MKALYITRKYPPSVGGMQKMNYHLAHELGKRIRLDKIAWGYSQAYLPIFILKAILQAFFYTSIQKRRYDFICIGDAMLAPLGLFFKRSIGLPVVSIAHGLDITFNFPLYQKIIVSSLKGLDMIVCVSQNTKEECLSRGIEESAIRVIPNGVNLEPARPDKSAFLNRLRGRGIFIPENARILLTVGRLVRRKGMAEFVENVFGPLRKEDPNAAYLIIGSGKDKSRITETIDRCQLGSRVFLLGRVDEELLHQAYAGCDIFVMPNIKVEGDPEGFGMVCLEASGCGIPVVASDLEGIRDAVRDGQNGFLVPPDNAQVFKERILSLLQNDRLRLEMGKKARKLAEEFSWEKVADRYLNAIRERLNKAQKKILMMSRAIEPPWDEASKNLVRDITNILDGYQFHILTTDKAKEKKPNIAQEEIYRNKNNTLSQKLRLFLFLLKNRASFDIYHFCFTPEPLTSFLVKALVDKDKKIWSIPYLSPRISKVGVRRLAGQARALTVTSEFSRDLLKKENSGDVELIYPGVDLARFKLLSENRGLKEAFLLKGPFNVLYPGDLTTDVAAYTVESIIRQTAHKTADIDFVISSRIKKQADLRRRKALEERLIKAGLKNRIRFIDRVEDMPALIAACELIIYPYFEGFERKIDIPYVIIEAMACARPVIISDRQPLNEVLKDEAGMAIKADSAYQFSEAIIRLYNDKKLAGRLGMKNREAAERYFDIRKNIPRFATLYDQILGDRFSSTTTRVRETVQLMEGKIGKEVIADEDRLGELLRFSRNNEVLYYMLSLIRQQGGASQFISRLWEEKERLSKEITQALMEISKEFDRRRLRFFPMKTFRTYPYADDDLDIVAVDKDRIREYIDSLRGIGYDLRLDRSMLREPGKRFYIKRGREGKSDFPKVHLHLSVSWNGVEFLDAARVWERSKQVNMVDGRIMTLTAEDELLIISAHAIYENSYITAGELLHIKNLLSEIKTIDTEYMVEASQGYHWNLALRYYLLYADLYNRYLGGKELLTGDFKQGLNIPSTARTVVAKEDFPYFLPVFPLLGAYSSKIIKDLCSLKLCRIPREVLSFGIITWLLRLKNKNRFRKEVQGL